jgi:hypothetical protein
MAHAETQITRNLWRLASLILGLVRGPDHRDAGYLAPLTRPAAPVMDARAGIGGYSRRWPATTMTARQAGRRAKEQPKERAMDQRVRRSLARCRTAELTASDAAPGDEFGYSVALSARGSTALAGAPFRNTSTGAAYVFTEGRGA